MRSRCFWSGGRLSGADLEGLLSFYDTGAREGDFESGIRMALQAILASPHSLRLRRTLLRRELLWLKIPTTRKKSYGSAAA